MSHEQPTRSQQTESEPRRDCKQTALLAIAIALVLLYFTACGSSTQNATEVAGATAVAEATEEPTAEPTAEPTPEPTAAPTPEPTAEPTAVPAPAEPLYTLEGELPFTVEEINSFITYAEAETGREFQYPPNIVAQDMETFEAGLAPTEEEAELILRDMERSARYLQSMHFVDIGQAQLKDLLLAGLSSSEVIGGYFEPEDDTVYVPNVPRMESAAGDELFQALMVHELVHALDSQYVDLGSTLDELEALVEAGRFQQATVLQSVVEGRATSVQQRWMMENAPAIMAGGLQDMDMGVAEELPPVLLLELEVAYSFGAQFIEAQGGPAETWELYDNRPATTEMILFPDTPATEAITDVPTPGAEGPIVFEGEFGAADFLVWLLGESTTPDPQVIFPALTSADGWAGGSAVVWGDDQESCTRIALAADSAADLSEIEASVGRWVEDAKEGEDRRMDVTEDLVEVTSCAPYLP